MRLSLSHAIESLRSELEKAQIQGQGENLKLGVGEIELELEVAVETGVSTSAKANWWVVTGGVDAQYKDATKHKVKIKLQAIGKDGNSMQLNE